MDADEGDHAYEVVLAPAAQRVIRRLAEPDAKELADALWTELENGPNESRAIRFGSDAGNGADGLGPEENEVYTATPLSAGGYTVIHRRMSAAEIKLLARQTGEPAASTGFYVIDILRPESAFRPWPRPL
jgi:hypothetical protein